MSSPFRPLQCDAFYGPGKAGHTCTEYGYFLEDLDMATMDTSFWSMSRRELEVMDPQQRLILEVVYECLESSGTTNYKGANIGCYVGVFGEDWADLQGKDALNSGLYRITGYGDFTISNRVSYELGFVGPSMTIRTACSSSLTALYEACQGLYTGECSSAIVGGSNIILSSHMTVAMCEKGVISPTGYCRSFDASADGYARGEAVNAIHIKKLSDAVRDGDPIRAVIRAACINSDGRTAGLTFPNPQSHEALIRRSHQLAGITDLSKTAMVECHGTGTAVGDPLEAQAVANVFGEWGILIGSVKSNIGHGEGASGLSSVIKMVLALENQVIPPNINFKTPNPKIPFEKAKLRVPVECEPWPEDKAQRVAVNSFGIGGANAHVLLESTSSFGVPAKINPSGEDHPNHHLFVFSATHPGTLKENIQNMQQYLKQHPNAASKLSYTLSSRRERFRYRSFAIASGDAAWDVSSVQQASQSSPSAVFVFTGQGAQSAQMGKDLFRHNDTFRQTIQHLDAALGVLDASRSWTLEEELLRPENESRLSAAEFAQPCSTAIQIALVDVLRSLNVHPGAVVGHSSGETAAAYAAGTLSAEDAISVAYHRGQVSAHAEKSGKGGMLAVGLGRQQVSPYLPPGVTITCENSPDNVTLSGDAKMLDAVMQSIKVDHAGIPIRRLRINCAYHSAQMNEVEEEYRLRLDQCSLRTADLIVPFFSSVSGKRITCGTELGPAYWCQNLTSPVLFNTAITEIYTATDTVPNPVFIEIGPHSTLSGPLRQIAQHLAQPLQYVPILIRGSDSYENLLRAAGLLFQLAVAVNLSSLSRDHVVLHDLPTYAWHHEGQYWRESRPMKGWRLRENPHHDLLGTRIADGSDLEPTWRNIIRLDDVPWIRDHVVADEIIFPAAGYVSMAGEAICQLTGLTDFSVRNTHIINAMVIPEDQPIEVITQLRPARITTTMNSSWYDFTIASVLNGVWTQHCTGQGRGGRDFPCSATRSEAPQDRLVDPTVWYRVMGKFGFQYGPRFQGLRNITASVSANVASADVDNQIEPQESRYVMHPCTIDYILQLFTVASFRGVPRWFDHLAVPTFIDELYISHPSATLNVQAIAHASPKGDFYGDAVGFCGSELVFLLCNMRMSQISDGNEVRGVDPHAGAQLVWKPDLDDLLGVTPLMRPLRDTWEEHFLLEELALTSIIETDHLVQDIDLTEAVRNQMRPHLDRFRQWLRSQCERAERGTYEPLSVEVRTRLIAMSSEERKRHALMLLEKTSGTEAHIGAIAITRLLAQSVPIFQGHVDPLALLMKDDLLAGIYQLGQFCDYSDFFCLMAHSRPNMRILEIGAGTGGLTASVLPILTGPHGGRMYESYTYTDISAGFFHGAQKKFKTYDALTFQVLDIAADPIAQGFEHESYDLVLASNVLHATPSLHETLQNVRTLLRPTGKLFLQELYPTTKWINYVMGVLPGWWIGEDDNRLWEPYVSPERWDQELQDAGFSGVDTVVHDGHANQHIVSSPRATSSSRHPQRRVTILRGRNPPPREFFDGAQYVSLFQAYLEANGWSLDIRHLGDEVSPGQTVVSVLDLDGPPFVHSLTKDTFDKLKDFLSKMQNSPILWITKSSQVSCHDPRYSMILGLARTLRTELSIDLSTLEVDRFDSEQAWSRCVRVLQQVMHRDHLQDPVLDPINEFVYSSGTVLVSKYYPVVVGDEILDRAPPSSSTKRLDIGKRGLLQTLIWKPSVIQTDRDGDWVEVETKAVGLNFRDVLIAMGIVEGDDLGVECSGIVRRVGPLARRLCPGDRVMVCTNKTMATTVMTNERLCTKIAPGLSFVDAATIPCAFGTVIHSLLDVARLQPGQVIGSKASISILANSFFQTVLIHSASGGVGLAAIQICRMVGAEIYCTVGSLQKVEYLEQVVGIPQERIFHSRDSTFLRDVLAATNGRGVDVVLNSLSGELLHASWKCVAEFGTMVEIGKRDFIGKGMLAMDIFQSNRTFAGVDLAQIAVQRPEITQGFLKRCMEYFSRGDIHPLPTHEFTAANIEQAFRYMQKGTHIGKIVIVMPDSEADIPWSPLLKQPIFRVDGCHIIIGGLGGLGRSVSSWMVHHGARHVVFFSRSAGKTTNHDTFIRELRAQNCRVDLVSGDICNAEDINLMIKRLDTKVVGVMQASMVLKDASFVNMTFAEWQAAVFPKVQGTWNLHHSLEKYQQQPDYFVLFSSWSGSIGNGGQANYAAANTYLDAFVQFRHSLGLPCSTVNIGVMEDVGYVSRNTHILEHFRNTSTHTLQEQNLLDALQMIIDNSQPSPEQRYNSPAEMVYVKKSQLCIGLRTTMPLTSPQNRTVWKRDPRMAVYHNMSSNNPTDVGSGQDEALKQFLQKASTDPTILSTASAETFLAQEIGRALFGFMLKDPSEIDYTVAPIRMGVDSLLAIELRNWFRQRLGVDITVIDIMGSASLTQLGRTAAKSMALKKAAP